MSLQAGQYIGLVKFFRKQEYLNKFIDGCIYCNTPEYYRLSAEPGVSDVNESCHLSFRSKRGDSSFEVEIDGKSIGQVSDLTVRSGRKEGWLHCWAIIEAPETDQDIEILIADFTRLKNEFGPHYIFIDAEKSHVFASRVADNVDVLVESFKVTYLEHKIPNPSISTKNKAFSYQREFRFVFSECESGEVQPKMWHVPEGFRDLCFINPTIELKAQTDDRNYSFKLEK